MKSPGKRVWARVWGRVSDRSVDRVVDRIENRIQPTTQVPVTHRISTVALDAVRTTDWPWPSPRGTAWDVNLRYQGRMICVRIYAQADSTAPTTEDVLRGLLQDRFSAYSTGSYTEWLTLLGCPDTDCNRQSYDLALRHGSELARLLGEDTPLFAEALGVPSY